MSTIENVGNTATTVATSGTAASGKSAVDENQDRFLKLLVTQMKNQDPLNPMDNAQVTSQMAQLSTVSGIDKLNTTLQSMSTSFLSSQSLQAAALVGRSVLAPGSRLDLANGTAAGGVDLPQAVDSLVVTIKDAAGNVLHSVNLGAQQAGNVAFQWDGATDAGGTATNGLYAFEVSAVQGGAQVSVTPLEFGKVGSVTLGSQGVQLNVNGLGAITLSDVKQIM